MTVFPLLIVVEGVSASEFFGVPADVLVDVFGVVVVFSGADAVVLVGAVTLEAAASVLSLRPNRRSNSLLRKLLRAFPEVSDFGDSTADVSAVSVASGAVVVYFADFSAGASPLMTR